MDTGNILDKVVNWPFLQEPFYRWIIFLTALGLALSVQHSLLRHMKAE
jgi:hypothetical protein